jgi:hypothetical protein
MKTTRKYEPEELELLIREAASGDLIKVKNITFIKGLYGARLDSKKDEDRIAVELEIEIDETKGLWRSIDDK